MYWSEVAGTDPIVSLSYLCSLIIHHKGILSDFFIFSWIQPEPTIQGPDLVGNSAITIVLKFLNVVLRNEDVALQVTSLFVVIDWKVLFLIFKVDSMTSMQARPCWRKRYPHLPLSRRLIAFKNYKYQYLCARNLTSYWRLRHADFIAL